MLIHHRFTLREREQLAAEDKKDGFAASLSDSWRLFRQRFSEWRMEQAKHMPLLALPQEQMTTLAFEEEEEDGHELLALPSDFTAKEIETYQIRVLATYELKLRVGLAFDLLREVRQAVQHSAVHLDEKIKHANSKTAHLREIGRAHV